MKDLRQMFSEMNEYRKENPKDFYGSIVFVVMMFGGFYAAMWIAAICEGRA